MLLLETRSEECFLLGMGEVKDIDISLPHSFLYLFTMQASFLSCFHIFSFPLLLPGYPSLRQTIHSVININNSGNISLLLYLC